MFGLFVILLFIAVYYFGDFKTLFFEMDERTLKNLEPLHPEFKTRVTNFLEECERAGLPALTMTDGLRTADQQNKLFDQGRKSAGKVVTNAKAYESLHNYGLAGDFYQTEKLKNGVFVAPTKDHAKIAQKFGLTWGGTFKGLGDKPHFEYSFGLGSVAFISKYKPKALAGTLQKSTKGYFII